MPDDGYLFYASEVPLDVLESWLDTLSNEMFVYLENEAGVYLEHWPINCNVAEFPVGRVFGSTLELRWQRSGALYNVQVLTELPSASFEGFTELNSTFSAERTAVRLWGRLARTLPSDHYLHGDQRLMWIETRIPGPLKYPIDDPGDAPWVQIVVMNYYEHGMLRATRWCGVEPVSLKDQQQT